MTRKARAIWNLLLETVSDWREDKAPGLAAALAYYTAFSLAPLLILAISITGILIGDSQRVRDQMVLQAQATVGQQGAEMIETILDGTSAGGVGFLAGLVSLAMLLLGATGVFGQLKDALNTIWEVAPQKRKGILPLFRDRFLSLTMVAGMSFLLLVSLLISAGITFINEYLATALGEWLVVIAVLNIAVSMGIVTLVFAVIFKVLPDVDVAWRDVWAGALVTAVLFAIGKELLGFYLGRSSVSSSYGAAGSLVVILTWVHYSAQILFLGAEFTQVYSRRRGSHVGQETRRTDWRARSARAAS